LENLKSEILHFLIFLSPLLIRAAQSLTATLCGCLSKHICILRQRVR